MAAKQMTLVQLLSAWLVPADWAPPNKPECGNVVALRDMLDEVDRQYVQQARGAAKTHRQREVFEKPLHDRVDTAVKLLAEPSSQGLLLYQCVDMWSSQFGAGSLLVFGPTRTVESLEKAPQYIGDLPSQRRYLQGYCHKPAGDPSTW